MNKKHYIHNERYEVSFEEVCGNRIVVTVLDLDVGRAHSETESVEDARVSYKCYMTGRGGYKVGRAPRNNTVDVAAILETLNHAIAHGVTSPRMDVEGFCFKLGKPGSKNPGWVYVNESGEWGSTYYGKISPEGEFTRSADCTDDVVARLVSVSADVVAAAKAYGRKTGACSFCRRKLTHKNSIALSYGPICAENYGLPHTYEDAPDLVS